MDYVANLNHNYESFQLDEITHLKRDDSIEQYGAYSGLSTLRSVINGVLDESHSYAPILYVPVSSTTGLMFFHISVDYVELSFTNYQVELECRSFKGLDFEISYANSNYNEDYGGYLNLPYPNLEYLNYDVNLENGFSSCLFDLTQMKYNYYNTLYQNMLNMNNSKPDLRDIYNSYCLYLGGSNLTSNSLTISYSDTQFYKQYRIDNAVRDIYYGYGYHDGWVDGFDEGKDSNIDTQVATGFDYVGGAFKAVSDIMAIEFFPHIPLSMVVSIPLSLVLIMTIFRIIKK